MKKTVSDEKRFIAIATVILVVISMVALFPMILLVVASFTDENELITNGYQILPKKLSLEAYTYMVKQAATIVRAYIVTIGTTVVGTGLSVLLTTSIAYPMARKTFKYRNALSFFVYFTMLFNGGLIPTYYFYTTVFHIKNTYFAYIVPNLLCSAFNVILLRNYFANSVSPALRESAKIDGCSEFKIFRSIIVPLSTPILATIGLLSAIAYWNDWQNALYYVDNAKYASIQQVLRNMTNNISYLANTSSVPSASRQVPGLTVRMAIAVLSMAPLMIAFPFFERYFVKGITIGAVKE